MSVVVIVCVLGDFEHAVEVCTKEVVRLKMAGETQPLFVGRMGGSEGRRETLKMALPFPTRRLADRYVSDLSGRMTQEHKARREIDFEILEAVELKGAEHLPPLFP